MDYFKTTMKKKNVIVVIPARYASTRFQGKPLTLIHGKTMIQRVYEQASKSIADKVIVATDSQEIFSHVTSFGGVAMMTSENHKSGTERCAEVIRGLLNQTLISRKDIVINVQGDEPFIRPEQVNIVANSFIGKKVRIATLVKLIESEQELKSPNVVKTVLDTKRRALYFSRLPIPFTRNEDMAQKVSHWKHIGIYGYRVKTLLKLVELEESLLERAEMLEQLRWLENGYRIHTEPTNFESIAIDTPEDLKNIPASLSDMEQPF